jgi:hypothetical protein
LSKVPASISGVSPAVKRSPVPASVNELTISARFLLSVIDVLLIRRRS